MFKHVQDYLKEQAAAATEAAAAVLAGDRFGALNVPLAIADATEICTWMQGFQKGYIQSTGEVARFKDPTAELKKASRTIISRAQGWKEQHSCMSEEITEFCEQLASCIKLAFNV